MGVLEERYHMTDTGRHVMKSQQKLNIYFPDHIFLLKFPPTFPIIKLYSRALAKPFGFHMESNPGIART